MDYRKEFEREIEKMRKLVEELNSFMEENGMPVNREDNKVLESKITALESLGGLLKSDPSDLNVIFMVKSANHGIELMLQDLKYAGPFGATETLEEDEELQDILDMFGVEREKLSQGYMDENSDDYFSIEFDEDYMDEIIVKTKDRATLIPDLQETFANLRKINLKLNPEKCVFGVPFGKLLGFFVSQRRKRPIRTRSKL